ncbi:hypothetical protein AAA799N04_01563 [Marine Group I thaumarchaeote SCGC AAA799-N04]|uniref:Uncharacterized protein n=2 Tax=Marine Group I TaxID=905826 RepID=A0A081RLF6_9ARCH|nr:hypothetical protein AAA799N04_01563 [Marine Group I thaumarchaeote SCGC AAA799-N04]KFM16183.1 hypothetical protein AAA799D11_00992 [Marine Group I thaumarchaeote SCGC AAA799-D11]
MRKQYGYILSIATVAVVGMSLLGSTFTQTQIAGQSFDASKLETSALEAIHQMGGLQLVMPEAFAETDCGTFNSS